MPTSRSKKQNASRPRHESEVRAARWYRRRGWRILATNVWLGGAELDVVARRGGTLVFCEVKSKSGDGFGDPLEMVTPEKIRRIRRAADLWLARHPDAVGMRVRFDVIADRAGRLQHLANAFE